jgi:hypothetical protein
LTAAQALANLPHLSQTGEKIPSTLYPIGIRPDIAFCFDSLLVAPLFKPAAPVFPSWRVCHYPHPSQRRGLQALMNIFAFF